MKRKYITWWDVPHYTEYTTGKPQQKLSDEVIQKAVEEAQTVADQEYNNWWNSLSENGKYYYTRCDEDDCDLFYNDVSDELFVLVSEYKLTSIKDLEGY